MLQSGIMSRFIDVQREGYVAFRSGNFVLASILLGLAAELLVKDLVTVLLWEAGTELPEAKRTIKRLKTPRDFVIEAKTRLIEFLGDAWTPDMEAAFQGWRSNVAKLRNEAMHQGTRPTEERILIASRSYSNFQKSLMGAVTSKSPQFPVTATLTGNIGGLNAISVQSLKTKYGRCLTEVTRLNTPLKGDLGNAIVYLVVHEDNQKEWYLVDFKSELATKISAPKLEDKMDETIQDLSAHGESFPLHFELRKLAPFSPIEKEHLVWRPLFIVFPDRFPLRFTSNLRA